jgi:thioesterase domain-containing protein/acyl carrier protein
MSQEQQNMSDVLGKELLSIWQRSLKNKRLTIDDDFFEYGGDSLLAAQIVLEIEKLTKKSLPTSIIFETGTVRQLIKKIISTDELEPRASFLLGPENGKIIHYFHGHLLDGGANVKPFYEISGKDFLIHAIHPHLPKAEGMPNSIEEMAKERLPQILEKQPEGPYILLGHCNGALVGFEAARQLISMGKEVKAMVMVDPNIMSIRKFANLVIKTANFFMHLFGIHESIRRQHLRGIFRLLSMVNSQTKDFGHRVFLFLKKKWPEKLDSINTFFNSFNLGDDFYKDHKEIFDYYNDTLLKYKPFPLKVPVLYISLEFSGKAWRRITKDVVYINIRCGHHNSWKEDYSQDLVNKIMNFIRH